MTMPTGGVERRGENCNRVPICYSASHPSDVTRSRPMPQYRMIAIDLDGTLLSPTGQVTARAKEAVQKCLSAGLLVCFATGRNWTESQSILDTVGHWPTAVFVGGAMVVDTQQRITLHRTMMAACTGSRGRGVPRKLRACSAGPAGYGSGRRRLFDDRDLPPNDATRQWMKVTETQLRKVGRLC